MYTRIHRAAPVTSSGVIDFISIIGFIIVLQQVYDMNRGVLLLQYNVIEVSTYFIVPLYCLNIPATGKV